MKATLNALLKISDKRIFDVISGEMSSHWNHEGKLMSWKDLGKELDFDAIDLDRIERGHFPDTKMAVMKMLEEWDEQMQGNKWKDKILLGNYIHGGNKCKTRLLYVVVY